MTVTLYPHQQQAVNETVKYLRTHRYALIELAVGLGKSYIISTLASMSKSGRAVILQPAMELVKQNHEKLAETGLNCTMIDSAHKGDWKANYIYTTPQTLCKNLDKLEEPSVVLIDEAHMFYSGKMFNTIFKAWKNCKVVLLTATPYYNETKTVYEGGYMYSVSTTRSIADELGIEPCVRLDRAAGLRLGYGCHINFHKVKMVYLKSEHFNDPATYWPMIQSQVQSVRNLVKNMDNCIIYCQNITQAEYLQKELGLPCECVFGKTPKKKRIELIDKLKNGVVRYVLTVGCLKLGFDFPGLKNILLLANFNNECEAEQIVGRLNRGHGEKDVYYIGRLNNNKPVPGKKVKTRLMAVSDFRRKRF